MQGLGVCYIEAGWVGCNPISTIYHRRGIGQSPILSVPQLSEL